MEPTKSNQPAFKIRSGRVSAAIWTNKSKDGETFHSVTFERSYKKADGSIASTSSFNKSDLANLASAALQAEIHLAQTGLSDVDGEDAA